MVPYFLLSRAIPNTAESDRTSLSSSQEAWIEQVAIFTSP